MPATSININFSNADALQGAHMTSAEDWSFSVVVKRESDGTTTTLGNPAAPLEIKQDGTITLQFDGDFPIHSDDTQFTITITGTSATTPPKKLGTIKAVIKTPILHTYLLKLVSDKQAYAGTIHIACTFSDSVTGAVTTVLRNDQSATFNTLLNQLPERAAHISPVIPVPWASGIPPLPRGIQNLRGTDQENFGCTETDTALNTMVNPAVIPVLNPQDDDFADKVARIRITQFWPADLDTDQFIWRSKSANVQLWNGASAAEIQGGIEIMAYATAPADDPVEIALHWNSPGTPQLASFRALAAKPKYVWTRFNIISTTTAAIAGVPVLNPTAGPADIHKLITFANILLWQAGIMLALDTDTTCFNNAVPIPNEPGMFTVSAAENYTFNVEDNGAPIATLLNSRNGVFNCNVIHSVAGQPMLLGEATDRRTSAASKNAKMTLSPSVAWVRPTGVFPDDPAAAVTMLTMGPSDPRPAKQKPLCGDGSLNTICACLMTNRGTTKLTTTIAHELCHILGLNHRGFGGFEVFSSTDNVNHQAGPLKGMGHPWFENLMCYGRPTVTQDLDILQAQVIRAHQLLKDTSPPVTPLPIPPIPAANLPTTQDKTLLQQYLSGQKPGLAHNGYNLGTSGPAGDGIDGVVGPITTAAIKRFQTDHGGLAADGIYGPKTRAAFVQEINATLGTAAS